MISIVNLDDMDIAAGCNPIPEVETFRIGYDNVWYDIDLNEKHGSELWEKISPYLEAGRRDTGQITKPAKRANEAAQDVPKRRGVLLYHAAGISMRIYMKGLRKWAAENNEGISIATSPGGIISYEYLSGHYTDYESWLTEQDRQRMTG